MQSRMPPTQSGNRMSQGLDGVRQAAWVRKQERFTALLHHVTLNLLRDSFFALKRQAASVSSTRRPVRPRIHKLSEL